ncbi:ABC transporter substrate-binding protein [Pseudonocardia pini]|uniref:ABC transporter substrate-binding protein n=1 Tax=Pseudonocardia pini TaxID=2758030 RepID=UPI0015F06C8E|nr:ABC transporter substrate-binding protein [Pseudonocardia pini]
MTTSLRLAALAAGAALVLAGCGGGDPAAEAPAESATRTVDVGAGPVEVPSQPKRIAVLSGGLAGTFYALGAPVAGTDTSVLGITPDASGFPSTWAEQAKAQGTTILSKGGEGMNLEAIAALQPDLIVGGGQGITAVQAQEVLPQLQAIAPTVLVPRTTIAWNDQLDTIADIVNAQDEVPGLKAAFEQKLAATKAAITPPTGPVSIYLSLPGEKLYMAPPTAAYPTLLSGLGFTLDPVVEKADNPRIVSTGDSFEISPELLANVANAPNMQVIEMGGQKLDQLKANPVFAQLPAFQGDEVKAMSAVVYRPDYPAVMVALDQIAQAYPKA